MKNKTLRYILTIIWGMIFIINLLVAIWTLEPNFFSWILVGFPFGGLVILLIDNSIINRQEDFINSLMRLNSNYTRMIGVLEEGKKKRVHKK